MNCGLRIADCGYCGFEIIPAGGKKAEASRTDLLSHSKMPGRFVRRFGLLLMSALLTPWVSASETSDTSRTNLALRTPPAAIPTVGMEGRLEVTLPGTILEAKPVEPKSLILLRIAGTRPHGTLIYYDLRYVGLAPGKYDLRNYLARKDGSETNDLAPIPVQVAQLLPEKHQGELIPQAERPFRMFGGYKVLLTLLLAVWALLLIPLWLMGRRRKTGPMVAAPVSAPSLADRLRPLIEQAAAGQLSRDGQAQLERPLLTHWRRRLDLEEMEMSEAIHRLRQHPEGGVLFPEL